MEESILDRIAIALERIAVCMENKQLREIATYRKGQATLIAEKKKDNKRQVRSTPLPEKKQTIRVRTSKSFK